MCKSCPYFDGFGCTRSPIVDGDDERCVCDADETGEEEGYGQREPDLHDA